MNVLAYNRTPGKVKDVDYVALEELLEKSDIVSLHVPLTPETKGIIGEKELALMKPSAILINTARGPVADTKALGGRFAVRKNRRCRNRCVRYRATA